MTFNLGFMLLHLKFYKYNNKKRKNILQMHANSDSDFIPNSDDEKIKIADPKLLNKKRKARLKAKDV